MAENVVVEKDGSRWAVRRESTQTPISTHVNRDEALDTARQLASQGAVDLIYEDESGNQQRETHERE